MSTLIDLSAPKNNINNNEKAPIEIETQKSVHQLFPFKLGIDKTLLRMTDIGLYSITPYKDADYISISIKNRLGYYYDDCSITDSTAGMGGNTLSFSKYFTKVYAIEKDIIHYNILKHNTQDVYGTLNVDFINCDYINVYSKFKQDVIFIDPPWGGPDYKKQTNISLYLGKDKVEDFIKTKLIELAKMFVIKVPNNFNIINFNKVLNNFNIEYESLRNYYIIYVKKI
jgi:16S rRNA G966 N2-methylase RsmD